MAAAVADFRPRDTHATKIKKAAGRAATRSRWCATADILAELAARPGRASGQVVVGFAAETGDAEGDVLTHGRAKLAAQGLPTCSSSTRSASPGTPVSRAPTTRRSCSVPTAPRHVIPSDRKEALADTVWDLRRVSAGAATTRDR